LHNRLKIKFIPFILISHGDMDHMAEIEKVVEKCLEGPNSQSVKPDIFFTIMTYY